MKWQFPLINPTVHYSTDHYIDHVMEEVGEVMAEVDGSSEQAKEVVDVLHAAETLVRKFFERNPQHCFNSVKQEIIRKNTGRGYYEE